MLETLLIPIIILVSAVITFIAILASAYTVVPSHEAHVVVTRAGGRKLYSSRAGDKSSYFMFPIVQKRAIVPLRNKELTINDIPLRDKDIAKFRCDVVCWINVNDPVTASERIGATDRLKDFSGIQDDITDLVKSVTRNSSMKMDLVSLMSDRLKFSKEVAAEIQTSIKEWGITLVDLECIHFTDEPGKGEDDKGYEVITNLEKRQAKVIEATTRKLVAEKEKEAAVKESEMDKEKRLKQAENEQTAKEKEIEKDEAIGKAEQKKVMEVQKATEQANKQTVEANKTLKVGNAEVAKQETITKAEGDAEATKKRGQADADVTLMTGEAESKVVRMKAVAEANGIDAKATAQKKYQTKEAMAIEVATALIDSAREIEIAKYTNLGEALQKANVNIVSTGEKELFGIPLGAETGLALGGMVKTLKGAGFDIEAILRDAASVLKDALPKGKDATEKTADESTEAEATDNTDASQNAEET